MEGNDPPKVVVREAHKRGLDVFWSFRMNDIHDGHLANEVSTFKEEHPAWVHPYSNHFARIDEHRRWWGHRLMGVTFTEISEDDHRPDKTVGRTEMAMISAICPRENWKDWCRYE